MAATRDLTACSATRWHFPWCRWHCSWCGDHGPGHLRPTGRTVRPRRLLGLATIHTSSAFDTIRKPFKIDMYFPSQAPVVALAPHSMPKWRNWQTRMVQVHVLARVWGFESLLRHFKLFSINTLQGCSFFKQIERTSSHCKHKCFFPVVAKSTVLQPKLRARAK